MTKKSKTIFWIVISIVVVILLGVLFTQVLQPQYTEVDYKTFYERVESGEISEIYADGYNLKGEGVVAGKKRYYETTGPSHYDASNPVVQHWLGLQSVTKLSYEDPNAGSIWSSVFTIGGIVLVAIVFYLIMRSAAGGGRPIPTRRSAVPTCRWTSKSISKRRFSAASARWS